MKEIILSRGMVALVDDEDFERVNQFKWNAQKGKKTFYASRYIHGSISQRGKKMHQLIMEGKMSDHIDRNGLNCQKSNLRPCTNQQNQMNRPGRENSSSTYKGVSWQKKIKKWGAYIRVDYKLIHLGFYVSEIEAAKAYDKKALELFSEFAYLNFKDPIPCE